MYERLGWRSFTQQESSPASTATDEKRRSKHAALECDPLAPSIAYHPTSHAPSNPTTKHSTFTRTNIPHLLPMRGRTPINSHLQGYSTFDWPRVPTIHWILGLRKCRYRHDAIRRYWVSFESCLVYYLLFWRLRVHFFQSCCVMPLAQCWAKVTVCSQTE